METQNRHFFPQLMNVHVLYSVLALLSPDLLLSIYLLQVNQAVSDFSNERDKVVGQLRDAEVASTIVYLHFII